MARGVSSTSHANTPNPLVFLICPSPWQQRALVAHEDPGAKPVTYGEILRIPWANHFGSHKSLGEPDFCAGKGCSCTSGSRGSP
jgi:hypothetical protein